MKENEVIEKKEIGKEKFKELAKDMKPVINDMEAVLKKHGIECLSSLTMNTDGYFNFGIHDSDWEFKRTRNDSKSVIAATFTEEI